MQTIITGDEMLMRKKEGITVVKGNGQVVRGNKTIKADTITYSEKQNQIDANGNVRFFDTEEDGSKIKAVSENATYNTEKSDGKLWGGNPAIEYNIKNSTDIVYLYADTFYLDQGFQSARAESNVKIISSSGTITGDNAKVNKSNNTLFMYKDINRPKIVAYQDDKYAEFEADELYLYYDKKTVKMDKDVKGKFIMNTSEGKK
ncbi:MAG: LptA/OstA family protein [Endomicrobiaceae bacterium]|nr:LptA/OstA family protein [Endomicrobiaceae bacterium]